MRSTRIRAIAVLILTLAIAACQTEQISQDQLKLARYTLKINHLPKAWRFTGRSWSTDFSGDSYTATYEIDDHNFLSHTISLFPNEVEAEKGYEEWNNEWFNSTQPNPEATYSPLNSEDVHRFECVQLSTESPVFSCSYLQRHGEVISFVLANLTNNTYLTFTELNQVLGILDERVNTVALESEKGTPVP